MRTLKQRKQAIRTLKQVNKYYSSTGYEVARVNGAVEVSFEGNYVWTFHGRYTVAQVVEAMSEMPWLFWGNKTCELSETDDNSEPVITKSQALELGFCFQYHRYNIQVYRPDGTSFYAMDMTQALAWISNGTHLCTYEEPPCDNITTPLLSSTVPSSTSYWLEPDARPLTQLAKGTLLLLSQGYDPDKHRVDLSTGKIYTLDGGIQVGTTSEQRW